MLTVMKKAILIDLLTVLLLLLFAYTAASKFLDMSKFIFQMRLAPVPLVKIIAPVLGWTVPVIEMIIAIVFALGFFHPVLKIKAMYASVILLVIFEIYIATMVLSGSRLPCTCGGIVSKMGWTDHLFFNGFFIITGILSIKYLEKQKNASEPKENGTDKYKILSRA
jgi:putative oxidoreductase